MTTTSTPATPDPTVPPAATTSLAAGVAEQARSRPHAPCITDDTGTTTFAELDAAGTAAARAMIRAGVRPGDRVAVLAHSSVEYLELLVAGARAGAIVVALNWRLARAEVTDVLADATPVLVFVGAEFAQLLDPAHVTVPVVVLEEGYRAWTATSGGPVELPGSRPDDVAVLLYTSGTTGRPKGVMLTHAGVAHAQRLCGEVYDFSAEDTMLVLMPMFHVGGLAHVVGPVLQGGHAVLVRQVRTAAVLQLIERHRVTHGFFVPTVIQSLLAEPAIASTDLSSLRRVMYGSAPISEALLLRAVAALRCDFLHAYGLTEAGGTATALAPAELDAAGGRRSELLRSCGRAVPWADVGLFHPETRQPVAVGEVGELWIRSSATMVGYWERPVETAEVLVDGGWLRTGDAAYGDAEGHVFIHDRFKDMIISGGENVYPAEVDNAMSRHPAVAEVAVIGVPHPKWGETVKAVVVLADGATATADELIAFTREQLAHYKCPTSVEFVTRLPRNASGKIQKGELRALLQH